MYRLIGASIDDMELLLNSKLSTIMEYAGDLEEEEIKKIHDYVNESVPSLLNEYKVVVVGEKKVGCFLITNYNDGVLLDEIYIDCEYRNKGMGTDIIKNILNRHNVVYLWVYKKNERARNLYRKLGFVEEKETQTRCFMKYVSRDFEGK